MIKANPYATYEDAARDYLTKLRCLMQLPQETNANTALSAAEMSADVLIRQAGEIADISSSMIQLAQSHLDSADPLVREGIRSQFIDQATVELLLGFEVLKIAEEQQTGLASTAAARATCNAALREAISAADKSSSAPLAHGILTEESYRTTESATIDEAAAALKLAVSGIASGINRRVQELGKDIAFDLMAGTQGTDVIKGALLSSGEIAELLESIQRDAKDPLIRPAAVTILSNVYEKIMALLDKDVEAVARGKISEWLHQIKQGNKVEIFDALVEDLFRVEALKTSIGAGNEIPAKALESVNKASDLVKTFSEKFMVLIGRMRKLEDAIRLGKSIQVPQLLLTINAMQAALLAALVYSGYNYINKVLAGILREKGFLSS